MNTIDLKHELIRRISEIEDIDFLNAIKTILDYKKKEPIIELSSNQENELLKASEAGKKGEFISQSEMDKKVETWLTEKKSGPEIRKSNCMKFLSSLLRETKAISIP